MGKDLYFRKEILFEALKNILANTSILLEEKGRCHNVKNLQEYTIYHTCICMRACHNFFNLNHEYTKKEIALKKYNMLYSQSFQDAISSSDSLKHYTNIQIFKNLSEEEKFVLLAIYNLPRFFTTNDKNRIKHIINTYIPKVKKCLKNSNEYIKYFNLNSYTNTEIRSILFKFLVENG